MVVKVRQGQGDVEPESWWVTTRSTVESLLTFGVTYFRPGVTPPVVVKVLEG